MLDVVKMVEEEETMKEEVQITMMTKGMMILVDERVKLITTRMMMCQQSDEYDEGEWKQV
jgi:tetrahydromethanopterin S-methyltransferase subunit A